MVTGKRKEVGIILGASEHFWRRRIRSLHWLWEWCHSCRQWQNLKIVHFKHMKFMICQLYLTKAIKIIQADTEKIKIENISEARRQRQKKRMPKREWASYCEKLECHVLLRGQHRRCVITLTSENRLVKVDSYERENPRTQISWASRPYHLVHAVIHVCLVYWTKAWFAGTLPTNKWAPPGHAKCKMADIFVVMLHYVKNFHSQSHIFSFPIPNPLTIISY